MLGTVFGILLPAITIAAYQVYMNGGPMTSLDFSVVGKKVNKGIFEYDWQRAALYAVGIGAEAEELPFVYENAPGGFKVFPSFATIAAQYALTYPGKIDGPRYLHGAMSIQLFTPFPESAKISLSGEVTDIFDKGKAAVIETKTSGHATNGDHIFDAYYTHFYLGEGGFGGNPGPKSVPINPPEGLKPDFSITYKTTLLSKIRFVMLFVTDIAAYALELRKYDVLRMPAIEALV
jgi:hypothetical protein